MSRFSTQAQVCKVDARLGLVFGFAVVCKRGGEDYFDLQDEHVPEDVMLEAAADFMRGARVAKEMHGREPGEGTVIFAFPLTAEIASSLGIQTPQTGLLVGMRPDQETLAKFADGTYTGFSIFGEAAYEEVA